MNHHTQEDSSLHRQENRDKLFLWLAAEYSQFHQKKALSVEEFVVVPKEQPTTPSPKWCLII